MECNEVGRCVQDITIEELGKIAPEQFLQSPPRILLAEDCPDTQLLISVLLESIGAEVKAVSDGEECIEEALAALGKGKPYGVIVVDIRMPNIDGHATARILREHGCTVPMLAITSAPSLTEKNTSLYAGFNAFLAKNSLVDTIVPTLQSLLLKAD